MPQDIIKDFIGKVCSIVTYGDSFGVTGKIMAVEGNWMKVETKKEVKLLNTDMISSITILPEKYQK